MPRPLRRYVCGVRSQAHTQTRRLSAKAFVKLLSVEAGPQVHTNSDSVGGSCDRTSEQLRLGLG